MTEPEVRRNGLLEESSEVVVVGVCFVSED